MALNRYLNILLVGSSLALLGAVGQVTAGPVTIEPKEVAPLRDLVAKDKDAASQYAELKQLADKALTESPDPIANVISEGTLASDPRKVRTAKSLSDMQKTEALAWTWVIGEDARYAAKGREYILAWARTNRADGNAINESTFEPIIEAYDILRDGFSARDRDVVDEWLRSKVDLLWQDKLRQRENWQSHRLKTIGLIALTIKDQSMWAQVDKAYKVHMQTNFEAGGESIDFKRRDALHYHLYSVRPLLTLSCAAGRSGDDLFDYRAPNGAWLGGAVDFVIPYANRSRKHVEFAESQVSFDKKRGASGESEYVQRQWVPGAAAAIMFSEAACLKPDYSTLAAQAAKQPGKKYINWRSVLNAVAPAPVGR